MDEYLQIKGISFVWDRAKAQTNLTKHGIAFEQATEAFFDPFFVLMDASPEEQTREAIIGMDEGWNLLFVVHIVIEDGQIRIISARKATRTERQYYED